MYAVVCLVVLFNWEREQSMHELEAKAQRFSIVSGESPTEEKKQTNDNPTLKFNLHEKCDSRAPSIHNEVTINKQTKKNA